MDIIVKRRRGGFTLAEVLITLSIIGVVAALTIPSLIVNNQEKQTVVQLKKAYNVLSNAFSLAVVDYGNPSGWSLSGDEGHKKLANIFAQHLNVIKSCSMIDSSCYNVNYKYLNNTLPTRGRQSNLYSSDGQIYRFQALSADCTLNRGNGVLDKICASISVDLNGEAPPNQGGKDLFDFWITPDSIVPRGSAEATYSDDKINECHTRGFNCTAWVLLKENCDYLKGAISWD